MKIIKYRLFVILLICFQSIFIFAQTTIKNNPYNQVSIASPTAGSLGKYADIPVNNHTGVPQIEIPIYTVKYGPLSLPISLNYHSSGLKSQEPAGWVGAGWALNAGGVITRSVVGNPDEKGTNSGGFSTHGYYTENGISNYLYLSGVQDYSNLANGYKDGEPDLYFFNFGNYSGKFYFNDDHTPMLVPETDLKIEALQPTFQTPTFGSIQGFIITTPDGLKYYFGSTPGVQGTVPIEITNPVTYLNGSSTGTVISSWYLNKITSIDNIFSITLNYTPENYGYYTLAMLSLDPLQQSGQQYVAANTYSYDLIKNIVAGVRLSSISFPNGSVNFLTNSTPRSDLSDNSTILNTDHVNTSAASLSTIQITDPSGFCKNFNFTYGYFNDATTPMPGYLSTPQLNYNLFTDRQRLRLDQLQEQSCTGVTIPPHIFSYFGEAVPRRISFGIDHWGFINGQTNNSDLVPTYTVSDNSRVTTYYGANRAASWPAMRAGSLQKIVYPTGGSTILDFEPNDTYVNTTSSNWIVIGSTSVGFDGGQGPANTTFTVNGVTSIPISLTVNNYSGNFPARLDITNASQQLVYSTYDIQAGGYVQSNVSLSNGTYTATLSINSSGQTIPTGHGCSANLQQWQTNTVASNVMVGGLRIKTLTNNDNVTAQNIITSYTYLSGSKSTGKLYSIPRYIGIVRNDIFGKQGVYTPGQGFTPYTGGQNGCPTFPDATFYVSSATLQPLSTTQGYHLGYSQVKVSQSGNGYTIYKYFSPNPFQSVPNDVAITSVYAAGCDVNQPNYPGAPLPFDFMRGELQYQGIYNENGQVIKEVSYNPVFENNPVTTPGFLVKPVHGYLLGTFYNLSTAHRKQMGTVETMYGAGGSSVTNNKTDYYQSNFHHQVTSSQSYTSAGVLTETRIKYAQDFRIASCDAIADGWQNFTNSCNTCQSQYYADLNAAGSDILKQSNAYLKYESCQNDARIAYVSYRQSNFTNATNTFTSYHNTAKGSADPTLKPILELQDEYRNPAIELVSFKNGNLLAAAFNNYDYSVNPSQYVYLSKIQNLNLSSPSASFYPSTNSSSSVTIDSRYANEVSTKYVAGNLVQVIKKDGIPTTYVWGYNNHYPVAKIIGYTYDQLPALNATVVQNPSSDQALRTELNNLRTGLPAGALVNIYTYSKALGVTSETDATGKIMYYEYDALGHLKLIRDLDNNILKTFNYQYQQPQ